MAQLERYECRDHVSVYDTAAWGRQAHFQAATEDAAELSWSPDGGCLALMDGPLSYRVCVHAADGRWADHRGGGAGRSSRRRFDVSTPQRRYFRPSARLSRC